MITEIQKSINSILYERVASPFYGAFVTSWLVWNWKIIYLTLFVSESKIKGNKIDYIIEHFFDFDILVTYPLISTVVLLTIIPFITNGAFWLHIKFNKWKLDQKHKLEMTSLLTNEQSIQLREEIQKNKEQVEKLLEGKDFEIKQLNLQLVEMKSKEGLENEEPNVITNHSDKKDRAKIRSIFEKITTNKVLVMAFDEIVDYIQKDLPVIGRDDISSSEVAFFEANGVIKNEKDGRYSLTDRGNSILQLLLDNKF